MAESKRNKHRAVFRQQLAQTWDDAQVTRSPQDPGGPWENERVVEVKRSTPVQEPPAPSSPPETSVVLPKSGNPVFELVRNCVRRDGFTHPEEGSFVMLPKEFAAILALENKAVAQVVLFIICETIGWSDPEGRYGRREWVQLGQKHFEVVCGSKSQGFYGVKTAIQKGYIIRRAYKNTFEYSIRWKENDER